MCSTLALVCTTSKYLVCILILCCFYCVFFICCVKFYFLGDIDFDITLTIYLMSNIITLLYWNYCVVGVTLWFVYMCREQYHSTAQYRKSIPQ